MLEGQLVGSSTSIGVVINGLREKRVLRVRIGTLLALTEPNLTKAAPPRRQVCKIKTARRAGFARHGDRRRRADRLAPSGLRARTAHEILVPLILALLPLVRVLPVGRPRLPVGAFVAVIGLKEFIGLVERNADAGVLVLRAAHYLCSHRLQLQLLSERHTKEIMPTPAESDEHVGTVAQHASRIEIVDARLRHLRERIVFGSCK